MRIRNLLAMMLLVAAFPAYAADEGLYDPVAPKGSSFIRNVEIGKMTPYYIATKEQKSEASLEDGKFYSLVKVGDKPVQIQDKPPQSKAKAVISLYNFASQAPISLKTADGKIAVTEPAAFGEAKFRDINGTKVALSVFKGDEKLADIGEKTLKRGAGYTVLVTKSGDDAKAEFLEASVDTTK